MQDDARQWARDEFATLEVLDARLKPRCLSMVRRAMDGGGARISEVFADAAERQGAYDLLEGGRVSGESLNAAMAEACLRRCEGPHVYVAIDGTSIQVADRKRKTDLGLVGTYTNDARGLQVISALAVSLEGVPLGLAAQTYWARPTSRRSRSGSKYQPVHERESRYIVQTVEAVARCFASIESKPWMLVDRAGDATVILDALVRSGARFTVRSSWDRRIVKNTRLRAHVEKQRPKLRYVVNVTEGYNRRARTARLTVRATSVELNFGHDWSAKRANPTLNVISVREESARHGDKPLDWMLYTNAPIDTPAQIQQIITSYTMRWRIEDFHKTWKSGHCCVEDMQLRSTKAAQTWATLLAAVAARIERLRHLARNEPNEPATIELSADEIAAVRLLKRETKKRTEVIGDGMPTIGQAVLWLAELGGYAGKRSSRPGTITIGRGLERVAMAAQVIRALRKHPN